MQQDINLMHAGLTPGAEPFRSAQAGLILAAAAAVGLLAVFSLHWLLPGQASQADAVEQELVVLRARAASLDKLTAVRSSRTQAELGLLRATEAGERRMRLALDSGVAGRTTGYSHFLMALARQAQTNLWITGFSVAADGETLELQGLMTDPQLLPGYLRHLNSEPLFKGRQFAQISLKSLALHSAVAGDSGRPDREVIEFSLRGKPVVTAAAP